jgi:hypothetical protein
VGVGANYVEYAPSNCYSLAASVNPANAGTIKVTPPPNCEANRYEPGAVIEITASANPGWHFSTWSGAASTDSHTVSLTMDSHKAITAHFQSDTTCVPWFVLPLGLALGWMARLRRQ